MAERIVKQVRPRFKVPSLPKEIREKRVAAYARVSTDSDEQMGSVEAQKDYFEKLICEKPGWVLVGVYADEGISGTSLNHREAFARMIDDAMNGKIDLIVTKSLSRFARNSVLIPITLKAVPSGSLLRSIRMKESPHSTPKSAMALTE